MRTPILEYYDKQLERSKNWLRNLKQNNAPKKVIKRAEITIGLWQGRIKCIEEEEPA